MRLTHVTHRRSPNAGRIGEARRGIRTGFTMIEMMIAMILLSLVMAGVLGALTRQGRFYRSASDIMETRSQLRSATSILPLEIRGLASAFIDNGAVDGSDIFDLGQTSFEFRTTFGNSVMCETTNGRYDIVLAPDVVPGLLPLPGGGAGPLQFGGFLHPPRFGVDEVHILRENGQGSADDSWERRTVESEPLSGAATLGLCIGKLAGADVSTPRRVYRLDAAGGPLPADVLDGAPVRFTRRVRYRLYEAADDKKWYLGVEEWNGTGFGAIQPAAGPYLPDVSGDPANSGLTFTYRDEAGNVITGNSITDWRRVARVELVVRGATASDVSGSGLGTGNKRDQLSVVVAIRNRN